MKTDYNLMTNLSTLTEGQLKYRRQQHRKEEKDMESLSRCYMEDSECARRRADAIGYELWKRQNHLG